MLGTLETEISEMCTATTLSKINIILTRPDVAWRLRAAFPLHSNAQAQYTNHEPQDQIHGLVVAYSYSGESSLLQQGLKLLSGSKSFHLPYAIGLEIYETDWNMNQPAWNYSLHHKFNGKQSLHFAIDFGSSFTLVLNRQA
ncbi:hypothetical protein ACJX0J_027021 [Zea mays]